MDVAGGPPLLSVSHWPRATYLFCPHTTVVGRTALTNHASRSSPADFFLEVARRQAGPEQPRRHPLRHRPPNPPCPHPQPPFSVATRQCGGRGPLERAQGRARGVCEPRPVVRSGRPGAFALVRARPPQEAARPRGGVDRHPAGGCWHRGGRRPPQPLTANAVDMLACALITPGWAQQPPLHVAEGVWG